MQKPEPENLIKVAVVEDDREIREGFAILIDGAFGFRCVAACADAEGALVGLPQKQPDVVLMDIQLPGMSGIECIGELKRLLPATQIMMLTVFEDHDRIFQSLRAGASGYLVKKTPPAELLEAIRELQQGGSPMSSQIARRVVQEFQTAAPAARSLAQLSKREVEILRYLCDGHLYKEIANLLGISIHTVRNHSRSIYEKLQVRSRTQAIRKVYPA